jgi:hypothetical protein
VRKRTARLVVAVFVIHLVAVVALVLLGAMQSGYAGRTPRRMLARLEAPVRPLGERILANSEAPFRWLRNDLDVEASAIAVLLVSSTHGLLGGAFYSIVSGGLFLLVQNATKDPSSK